MENLFFQSGKLQLEAALESPTSKGPHRAGVIAHPHPNFGGSMHNNVVFALSRALLESGLVSLCFNFRGVGKSQGGYGEVIGEADDILAATEFLKTRNQVRPGPVVLCGYSFGGLAALHAVARGLEPSAMILVSPMLPEGGLQKDPALSKVLPLKFPALILSGAEDQFFETSFYRPMLSGASGNSQLVVVKGADHFWSGFERELTARVKAFLNSIPEIS
jgi:uncharacterized protein